MSCAIRGQLRYFLAVAEEGRFSRAANRLHIAAPSLSQQIQALERELRVRLFERTTQRVELTIAGQALVERARVILAEVERARADVRAAATRRSSGAGHRSIATSTASSSARCCSAWSSRSGTGPPTRGGCRSLPSPAR